jgi:hypothetical protein
MEAVFVGLWTHGDLGTGEEAAHGEGEDVLGGVVDGVAAFGSVGLQQLDLLAGLEGDAEVLHLTVDPGDDDLVGEARRDGFGEIEGVLAVFELLLCTIGEHDCDHWDLRVGAIRRPHP